MYICPACTSQGFTFPACNCASCSSRRWCCQVAATAAKNTVSGIPIYDLLEQTEVEYVGSSELLDMIYDHNEGEQRFLALVKELLGLRFVFDEDEEAYHQEEELDD